MPELGVHRDVGEAGQRVDLAHEEIAPAFEQEVDPAHAGAADRPEGLHRELAHPLLHDRLHRRRDPQLRLVLEVLVLVVVEVVAGHDLAHRRGLERRVAEHRALQLAATDGALHHHGVVEAQGEGDRGDQAVGALDAVDADARAAHARLDEDRHRQGSQALQHSLRGALELQARDLLELEHRQARLPQQSLAEQLVHRHGAGGDPGPDVGHLQHLQQPLQGPVLPPGAVHDREGHIDRRGEEGRERRRDRAAGGLQQVPLAGERGGALGRVAPGAVQGDPEGHHFVAGPLQGHPDGPG